VFCALLRPLTAIHRPTIPQISDAITHPAEHDDYVTTVLIGGFLSIFGFLLLPLLPVYGIGVLNGIPILGAVIGAFVFFHAQVVAARLWAGGYADARTEGDGTTRPDVGGSVA